MGIPPAGANIPMGSQPESPLYHRKNSPPVSCRQSTTVAVIKQSRNVPHPHQK